MSLIVFEVKLKIGLDDKNGYSNPNRWNWPELLDLSAGENPEDEFVYLLDCKEVKNDDSSN